MAGLTDRELLMKYVIFCKENNLDPDDESVQAFMEDEGTDPDDDDDDDDDFDDIELDDDDDDDD